MNQITLSCQTENIQEKCTEKKGQEKNEPRIALEVDRNASVTISNLLITFEKVIENPSYVIYRNSDKYTGIIFDQLSFDQFKKTVANVNIPISLYIFSLVDDDFSDDFADMRGLIKICAIPESILRVYRRIFR